MAHERMPLRAQPESATMAAEPFEHAGIVSEGAQTLAVRVVGALLAVVLGIVSARALGPAARGIYLLPMVVATLGTSFFSGLSTALSYAMLSERRGRGAVRAAMFAAIAFVGASWISAVIVAWVAGAPWAALPAAAALPCVALINVASGYAYGVRDTRLANAVFPAVSLFVLVFMLVGFVLYGVGAWTAIYAWVAGNAVVAVAGMGAMLFHARKLVDDAMRFSELAWFAARVGFVNLVTLFNYRADMFVVAALAGAAALGTYSVAVAGAESLLIVTQVAAIVTLPRVGSLPIPEAAALSARALRNNLVLSALLCVLAGLAAPLLVKLLYGERFMDCVPSLRVLLVGVVLLSQGGVLSNFFTLRLGKPQISLLIAAVSAVICLGLSALLVPRMGMIGAAWGTTIAYTFGAVWSLWLFHRLTGISYWEMIWLQRGDFQAYSRAWHRLIAHWLPAA